jgi:DNA-binding response OmpR family regulator
MQIVYRGQPLSLTRHEFRLLQCLLEQPQRVFSREQLLDALGVAADAGYERSIDSHIKSLRAKLRQVRPMPSRSRPIAASVTATARGTADALGLRIFLVYSCSSA